MKLFPSSGRDGGRGIRTPLHRSGAGSTTRLYYTPKGKLRPTPTLFQTSGESRSVADLAVARNIESRVRKSLTACWPCGPAFDGGASYGATSNVGCRPSSRHENPASSTPPTYSPYMSKSGHSVGEESGRYRIRTRVLGLEIQGDIQATLIARGSSRVPDLLQIT